MRRAEQSDWRTIRNTRLRALAESPSAFGSTLAREAAFDDVEWQRRVGSGNWFLAVIGTNAVKDETAIGIVATVVEDDAPSERHLVAMWVDPEHRGSSAATDLVEAVCASANADGVSAITLWVADGNHRALRFYQRVGFHSTGERQPLPSNVQIGEERMRKDLR